MTRATNDGQSRLAICLVSELPPPPGGMAVQARMLTEGLRREGHRVINVRCNALAHDSPLRKLPGLRAAINFVLYLTLLVPGVMRAQIVHIFSNSWLGFILFTCPAVFLARLFRRRLIVHYHGGAAAAFLEKWHWLAVPTLRAAGTLVVPSGFLAEVFRRYGLRPVEVVNILPLAELPYRKRAPLKPRLVMARHLEPDYNSACGLRAFAILHRKHADATLIVAGDGSERSALVKLAAELGISGAVNFTGNVANDRMRALFDQADIFLNSSRVDNQPVSILEAWACGLPVVSTGAGGIRWLVTDGVDGMLAPNEDAEQLGAHLLSLLENPALAELLARNGRERAGSYDWPAVYSRLSEIYRGHPPA
jgi:phenylacetate-CoA ligase